MEKIQVDQVQAEMEDLHIREASEFLKYNDRTHQMLKRPRSQTGMGQAKQFPNILEILLASQQKRTVFRNDYTVTKTEGLGYKGPADKARVSVNKCNKINLPLEFRYSNG